MQRSLHDIQPQPTSHGVGIKRVLLASSESGCSLTQIAVTTLQAGEVAVAHTHPDMQEGFYVLAGELEVTLGNPAGESREVQTCKADDFIYVPSGTSHELRALTDARIMTIGCVIEAHRNKLYPLLFKPNRKTLVWGTEDWTVSAVPGSEGEIENGTWARYRLTDVIRQMPEQILGKAVAERYDSQLPLLTKIIDAHQDLSIQVHPDDEMARREHGKFGKTEMWYVLDAQPGAYLYAGFKDHITPEEYKQRVADGTIVEALARHEVHKGDVFYLPAGRVHAICGGIRLAEVQQSSDVTYRIFDYNRPGLDGKPRELHTELASRAIDYKVYDEYRTDYKEPIPTDAEAARGASTIIASPYFNVKVTECTEIMHRNLLRYDSFIIVMCLEGKCKIRIRSTEDEVTLSQGDSTLIPAAVANYDIIPLEDSGTVRHLEAFIDNMDTTLAGKLTRFLHLSK